MNLTSLEKALIAATIAYKKYDDSNPDVGFGPSIKNLLNNVLTDASIDKNEFRYDEIIKIIQKKLKSY